MKPIITFFVKNWKFSFLCSFFLFCAGVLGLIKLKRESFPPVNFAVVKITTVFPGASPEDTHDQVTQYIENELRGIEGIKDVRSVSQNDLSEITIRIDIDKRDEKKVVDDIIKATQRASGKLPAAVTEMPYVSEIKAQEIPILEFALIGPNSNRERDRWVERLQDQIEDLAGVSRLGLIGETEREWQVLLNPVLMKKHYVALADVVSVLRQQIQNVPAGYVDNTQTSQLLRVMGKNIRAETLQKLPLRTNASGQTIRLEDVATLNEGFKRPQILTSVDGESATLLTVVKRSEADAIRLVEKIMGVMEEFKKNLPKGFTFKIYNNESARIANRLNIVEFNALSGLAIVLLVLLMILPGKIGVFSALSLPLSALGCVLFMIFYGATFNIITMIALVICLGNLVDNSVVISEYYTRLLEEGKEPQEAAILSAEQFWIPFTASTVTIVAAFLPMLVTSGVMGQFIRWIPIIVALALILSLFESLTLLPARLQFIKLKPKQQNLAASVPNKKGFFFKLENRFGQFIELTLKHYKLTLALMLGILFSGFLVTALFNRFELFPAEGVEYYVGRFEMAVGTSLSKTNERGKDLALMVKDKLGSEIIDAVIVKAGMQELDPSDVRSRRGENIGLILIGIQEKIVASLDVQETLNRLAEIPKPNDVEKLSFETIDQGPPVGKPLTVTLRSLDYKQLDSLRNRLMNRIREMEGVFNLEDDETDQGLEYQFSPHPQTSLLFGLDSEAIGFLFRTAIEGTTVAKLNENQREYDLVVKFDSRFTQSTQNFDEATLITKEGYNAALKDLGELKEMPAPKAHKNYNYQRAITLTAEVNPEIITSAQLNAKVNRLVLEASKEFKDVNVVFGGEEESTQESLNSLAMALGLAIFGIFATLVFTFNRFRDSVLVLSTIPLGLVGVFYGFALDQRPLSFLAFIGVIGLSGVVINSAIILVDYIRELQDAENDLSLEELLVKASKERLRAVLATGLTTIVGLMPTAFGLGGYDAILVPITFALSCGMIVGTVLSLVWIPCAYRFLYAPLKKKS